MMQAFSSSDILQLWDRGAGLHPLDRSLLAVSATAAAVGEDCADWPLGRRNRTLFELHASCFGSRLNGWSSCPECNEKVEFDVDSDLLVAASELNCPSPSIMMRGERFRLPTSRDVAAVLPVDSATVAISLLERCRMGDDPAGKWNEEEVREAGEILSAADPLAETQLALGCPSCGYQWNDVADIGSFFWAEIETRAHRLLLEVHALAEAYGWSEAETLSLSAVRRATYIRMVQT